MLAIFRKEINTFFSSLIGYVVIGLFLVILGLFMFVFRDTSLLDYGFATLGPFFSLVPNVFIFVIPAITMRAFAEERQSGAIELLVTKPIKDIEIILGKYFASLVLVLFALLPTLLYFLTVYQLAAPVGNIDVGGTIGSYIGLVFLAMAFVAIGLFASSLTSNQIVSLLVAIGLCFWCYFGFDFLADLSAANGGLQAFLQELGMLHHFNSLGRGLLDTRDIVYFLSITAFFIMLTLLSLERRKW